MKAKIFAEIKRIILNSCLYFTAAAFILLIFAGFLGTDAGGDITTYEYIMGTASLLYLGCFVMSLLNLIWKLKYSAAVKILLHSLCALVAYIVIFVWMHGHYSSMEQILVRVLLFVAAYFIAAFAALIIISVRKNRKADDSEYDSQFDKKSGNKSGGADN